MFLVCLVIYQYKTVQSYIRDQVLLKFSCLINKCLWVHPITALINNRLVNISSCTDKQKVRTTLNWCIIYRFPTLIWVLVARSILKCGGFQTYKRGLRTINLTPQITTLFNKTVTHFNWFILLTICARLQLPGS